MEGHCSPLLAVPDVVCMASCVGGKEIVLLQKFPAALQCNPQPLCASALLTPTSPSSSCLLLLWLFWVAQQKWDNSLYTMYLSHNLWHLPDHHPHFIHLPAIALSLGLHRRNETSSNGGCCIVCLSLPSTSCVNCGCFVYYRLLKEEIPFVACRATNTLF